MHSRVSMFVVDKDKISIDPVEVDFDLKNIIQFCYSFVDCNNILGAFLINEIELALLFSLSIFDK